MPYNYILSKNIQKRMKIELKDKIIIIDEAHNICKAAEEASSISLTSI